MNKDQWIEFNRNKATRQFAEWTGERWQSLTPFGRLMAFNCAWRGTTPRRLALAAGRSPQTYHDLMTTDRSPHPDVRQVLARQLGVTEDLIVALAGEQRWPRTSPEHIIDYPSLIETLCNRLKTTVMGLERRLGWNVSRLAMQLQKDVRPYPDGFADLAELIIHHVPEILPDEDDLDLMKWLADLTGLAARQEAKAARLRAGHTRQNDKVSRWRHQRLQEKIDAYFDGAVPAKIRREMQSVPYDQPVGARGAAIYRKAIRWRDPPLHLTRKPRRYGRLTARGRAGRILGANLSWLRRGTGEILQCQGCGDVCKRRLKERQTKRTTLCGSMCRPCWDRYHKHSGYMPWMRSGGEGDPPPIPRRKGPLIGPDELRRRLIMLLAYHAGRLDEELDQDPFLDNPHHTIRDTERRVRSSGDKWCQKIVKAIDLLS